MHRILMVIPALWLAACGSEVAGTAAVTGTLKAQEARQAQQTQQQFQQRLDAATQAAQQRQAEMDKAD